MKILFINACYPYGSTGKIVKVLEEYCKYKGIETAVVYGQGEKTNGSHYRIASPFYIKLQALRRRITGVMYGGCIASTNRAIRIIRKEDPDIVHLHCINSNFINIYRTVTWLKKNNIHTVLTNHAEFMYTANCGHALECTKYQTGCGNCPRLKKTTKSWFFDGTHRSWTKMRNAFDGFTSLLIINVSPWSTERASNSKMLKSFDHHTILNGVDTDVFYYRENHIRKEEKIIFHATANFSDDSYDIKGGAFLIQLAQMFEGQNVKFVVAGKYSLTNVIPSNMILLGSVSDQEKLAELYSSADLTVLTSKRETFSMITAESLCCGTPIVAFEAGGPDSIALPEYSCFVEYGDIESLYQAVQAMLSSSFDRATISKAAHSTYAKKKMAEEYLKVYNKCIQK